MNVLKLEGLDSYFAARAYHLMMLGMKMLPGYSEVTYEKFYSTIEQMTLPEQERMIREAALFVGVGPEEFMSLAKFCTDKNGVPYTAENIKNITPEIAHEIIVAVAMKILKIPIRLVSEDEKKN